MRQLTISTSTIATENTEQPAAGMQPAGKEDVASIERRLAARGLGTRIRRIGAQCTTAGVMARVALEGLLDTSESFDQGLTVVYAALRVGIPVTVTIVDPGGNAATDRLARFRGKFCEFLEAASVDRDLLGLCLSAAEMPPADFRAEFRASLGNGPRYVMIHPDSARESARESASESEPAGHISTVWRLLQEPREGGPQLWPAFAAGVRSHCPLLSGENSSGVLPGIGIAAPAGSAWLPIDLDICRFAYSNGEICHRALDQALDACVDLGDLLMDRLTWFDDRQRHDARVNRRLAVFLTGLGDLVGLRGEDPADLGCLRNLDQLVGHIHASLWQHSRRIAAVRGPLPALAEKQPRGAWRDESHRSDWLARWRRAVHDVQVRHRNLLVMSPYSVLPRSTPASPAHADLLPALAHADALSFANPPSLGHWNASDFKSFHQRIQALVERQNAVSFVAAGV